MLDLDDQFRIHDSLARLTCDRADMIDAFYRSLRRRAPQFRTIVPESHPVASLVMQSLITLTLQSLDDAARLRPVLRALGRQGAAQGLFIGDYRVIGLALIETLSTSVAEWCDEDRQAWTRLCQFAAGTMIAGAEGAREASAA